MCFFLYSGVSNSAGTMHSLITHWNTYMYYGGKNYLKELKVIKICKIIKHCWARNILLKLTKIKFKSTCHYWEVLQLDKRLCEFSVMQLEVIQLHTAAVYSYPYSFPIQLPPTSWEQYLTGEWCRRWSRINWCNRADPLPFYSPSFWFTPSQ